ncbi:very low-density lipoprotein receptor-like [Aplysia californica]|uniref:Very low-density lipoprotein receptor-like n=1 Tax=Aplysia californica TaxID=6500 RepID=A0ABM1VQU2_APLCA|nr:very low-density lipoprotein receptor-like [Aplysia californica]
MAISCNNGGCVPASYRCDGFDDCGDNTIPFVSNTGPIKLDVNIVPLEDESLYRKKMCILRIATARLIKDQQSPNYALRLKAVSCESDQFACSDKCINASWVCDGESDCLDGFDEQNCTAGCMGPNKISCNNGGCVPVSSRCDGDNDCGDSTDEKQMNCANSTCQANQFKCDTGACIPDRWRCDDDNDCRDNSDERDCQTCSGPTVFQCNNTVCLYSFELCDGDDDCGDNSDEVGCTCSTDEFTCKSGECLAYHYRCDGQFDCNDNSDEKDCPDIHPAACGDKLTLSDCAHMNVTSYPICQNEDDAFKYCREFCGLCKQN